MPSGNSMRSLLSSDYIEVRVKVRCSSINNYTIYIQGTSIYTKHIHKQIIYIYIILLTKVSSSNRFPSESEGGSEEIILEDILNEVNEVREHKHMGNSLNSLSSHHRETNVSFNCSNSMGILTSLFLPILISSMGVSDNIPIP